MLQLLATDLVYQNPHPHRRSVHAWHPTLVVLGNGQYLCAFDLGEAVESVDYRTYLSRSSDDGQTWSSPQRLLPDEDERLQRHSIRISRLGNGDIVGVGMRRFLTHPDEDAFNRDTMGAKLSELFLLRSSDVGDTWQGPLVVESPLACPLELCHTAVELADGRWLWPTSILRHWNGDAPLGLKAVALVSQDQGQSWPQYMQVLDSHDQGIIHFESSLVQLPDDRLLASSWAFNHQSGQSHPLPYALSEDGKTFSPAKPTGLNGETSKLLSLGDGRVFCVYRRFDKPGLWANIARIHGDQWENLEELPLWQGAHSKMDGTRSSADELSALAFGFPQPHLLPDGNVMIVFWCRENCLYSIRWLRVGVNG